MTRRLDPAAARKALRAISTDVYGDRVVVAWLKLFGAVAASERPGKAA